jgi:hypothetical protein
MRMSALKKFQLILLISCLFLTPQAFSLQGYVSIDKNITDVSWNFIPINNTSFSYSETLATELFLYNNKFGIKINQTNFSLDLERSIEPKKLELDANSKSLEIFIINNDSSSAYSFSLIEQLADPQVIDCYTFGSLTIGTCEDATLTITNIKPEYKFLGESLIWIDGKNIGTSFNIYKASNNIFFNEYSIYLQLIENKFNWVSPVEEIKTGFIANLNYNGQRIADLIKQTTDILPQREKWITVVTGITFKNSIFLTKNISFFYEPTFIFVKQLDYQEINNLQKYNIRLISGMSYDYLDLKLSFYGTYYKNNLYGFEHISFNQRSEPHYSKDFGSLGFSVTYKF